MSVKAFNGWSKKRAIKDLKRMRKMLEKQVALPSNDFWFNGKLWSEMTGKERQVVAKVVGKV